MQDFSEVQVRLEDLRKGVVLLPFANTKGSYVEQAERREIGSREYWVHIKGLKTDTALSHISTKTKTCPPRHRKEIYNFERD